MTKLDQEIRRHLNSIKALCDDIAFACVLQSRKRATDTAKLHRWWFDQLEVNKQGCADVLEAIDRTADTEPPAPTEPPADDPMGRQVQHMLSRFSTRAHTVARDQGDEQLAEAIEIEVRRRDAIRDGQRFTLTAKAEAHLARTPDQVEAQAEKH